MDTSDDNKGCNPEEAAMAEQEFLNWLRRHGAEFDSVDWPSSKTGSGIRGAVAKRDIETGDHMVVIPRILMMSEFHAKADPHFGHVHRLNARLLGSDNGLAVYVMQEILKGDRSFYWPYLRVLPAPHNLQNWDQESLLLLEDRKLVRRTASRARQLKALYEETIGFLSNDYPELYKAERYTFELFVFAWSTVQARAFGKRLKSSALVPFADCLNHGNVQTKYDFDVVGNGVFRLFPTGTNRYPRYSEVLNSYGRRANDTLLLDYGFAMLDNEWDTAEVVCSLPSSDDDQSPLDKRRTECLRASGQHTVRVFRLRRSTWDLEMLRFCRCACLIALELDRLEAAGKRQESMAPRSGPADVPHRLDSSGVDCGTPKSAHGHLCRCVASRLRHVTRGEGNDNVGGGGGSESGESGRASVIDAAAYPHLSSFGEICRGKNNIDGRPILPLDETKREEEGEAERVRNEGCENGEAETRKSIAEGGRGEGGVDGAVNGSEDGFPAARKRECRFPCRAMSAQNEVAALKQAIDCLIQARKNFPTTLEHDENEYRDAQAAQGAPDELLKALIYRITLKRIIARQLEMAGVAVALVQDIMRRERMRPSADPESNLAPNHDSRTAAPSSLSPLDQLLPLSPLFPEARLGSKAGGGGGGEGFGDGGIGGGGGGGVADHEKHHQHRHHHHHSSKAGGSPSFDSYLSDLENVLLSQRQQR